MMLIELFIHIIAIILLLSPISRVSTIQLSDLSYEEIEQEIHEIAVKNNDFFNVLSAEKSFGIPRSSQNGFSCTPSIVRISKMTDLREDIHRPQILISGEIHGDERVGPLSSLFMAKLMIWSAQCEIETNEIACRSLDKYFSGGISQTQRIWLAFLASRRDTFIIPTANCLGHKLSRRNDANNIDPNRDFPYSRTNSKCLLSNTAKLFDRLMAENIFQIVVTFHAGMVALGYEWGSKNHLSPRDASPDNIAHSTLATRLAEFAGNHMESSKPYPVGPINSLIYPVDGGMEDWLYAAGWDKSQLVPSCDGKQTDYKNTKYRLRMRRTLVDAYNRTNREDTSGNRALVFLVETSDHKNPPRNTMGDSDEVFKIAFSRGELSKALASGHVPRNTRLALMAADMVQPYVCFDSFALVGSEVRVGWYVGGANSVDSTFLTVIQPGETLKGEMKASEKWAQYLLRLGNLNESTLETIVESRFTSVNGREIVRASNVLSGLSRWGGDSATNHNFSSKEVLLSDVLQPRQIYSTQFKVVASVEKITSSMKTIDSSIVVSLNPGRYWLVAWASVDKEMLHDGQGYPANLSPQSHFSNIRTNPSWTCEKTNSAIPRSCKGQKFWPSDYIEVEVTNNLTVKISQGIKHCAWWKPLLNFENSRSSLKEDSKEDSEEETSVVELQVHQVAILRDEVRESYFFEKVEWWLLVSILALGAICFLVYAQSYYRRNRIYSTLLNNRYLNLPTGFIPAPNTISNQS